MTSGWYEKRVRRVLLLPLLATTALGCAGATPPTDLARYTIFYIPGTPRGPQLPPAPPLQPAPACPEDTYWTGLSCAHARVTCGGWDGTSCNGQRVGLTAEDGAAVAEYLSIDADARTISPEQDESAQSYGGHVGEVIHAVDAAIVTVQPPRK